MLTTPFFWMLLKLGWFRVEYLAEVGGLDAAYHNEALEEDAKMVWRLLQKFANELQEQQQRSRMFDTLFRH